MGLEIGACLNIAVYRNHISLSIRSARTGWLRSMPHGEDNVTQKTSYSFSCYHLISTYEPRGLALQLVATESNRVEGLGRMYCV